MKAVVVIDIDEKYIGAIGTEIQFINQKYNCKWELKPMPKKREIQSDIEELIWDRDAETIYALGFNRCIGEITGETE